MENSNIRDIIYDVYELSYNDDLERLKATGYSLEYILNNLEFNLDTDKDRYDYNRLTTCLTTIRKIIKENEKESEM